MDKVYLVYKTDANHSYASRDIIGVATSFAFAVLLCQEKAKKEGYDISGDQEWNLCHLKQTQNYNGEGEFQFEEIITNNLL